MAELYRHYGPKDELLYVGVSISALVRLGQHRDCSEWFGKIKRVEIQQFESREKALAAEREAIEKERPHFNVRHKKPILPIMDDESDKALRRRLIYFRPVYSVRAVKNKKPRTHNAAGATSHRSPRL
jgi:excinuclease UvrABC nuclease subunit